jgi:hypothetical protein
MSGVQTAEDDAAADVDLLIFSITQESKCMK